MFANSRPSNRSAQFWTSTNQIANFEVIICPRNMATKILPQSGNIVRTPPNSHVRKYSAYPQNLCTVLTQIFTNVESFTAEMHKISSNLTVNNDKLVDNFIFAIMHSPSTWSSSEVQAGASKIVNSYSLDWKIPELKHPAPKKNCFFRSKSSSLDERGYFQLICRKAMFR